MTAYENITAVLDRIEKVSKQGLNYAIELEDIEQLQEAQDQVKNIAYEPVLAPVLDFDKWIILCKPSYKAKDGTIKGGTYQYTQDRPDGVWTAPKDDMYGC